MANESKGAPPTVQITLGDALQEYLSSLKPAQRHEQERYVRNYVEHADPGTLDAILKDGADNARAIAQPIMAEVREVVGFWHA